MTDADLVSRAMKGVDVVYHLAINWDGHSWQGKLPLPELFDQNIRGTINLMEKPRGLLE